VRPARRADNCVVLLVPNVRSKGGSPKFHSRSESWERAVLSIYSCHKLINANLQPYYSRSFNVYLSSFVVYLRTLSLWGTALQVGRSRVRFPMVSLQFFIDRILPAALWPEGLIQHLTEMSTRNISSGVKATGA